MDERAAEIRGMVRALDRQRPNERIPPGVHDAVVEYALSRRPSVSWARLGDALGLAGSTIQRWCSGVSVEVDDHTALVPIVVSRGMATSKELALVSPRGFRLEGLNLDEAALLLDRLS